MYIIYCQNNFEKCMIVTQNSTDLHVTLNVTVSDLEHMNFTEIVGSLQGNSRSFLTNLTVFIRVLVLSCDSVLDECQFRSKETQTVFFLSGEFNRILQRSAVTGTWT